MRIHWKNFAGHYRDGKTYPFENKPVIDSRLIGLVLYIITYEVHKNFYNLSCPVVVIKFFFNAFKQRFVPSGKNVQKKFTFSIINFQSRRQKVWLNLQTCVFSNEFFGAGLGKDIKKRSILNALTGNSWRFNNLNFGVRRVSFISSK